MDSSTSDSSSEDEMVEFFPSGTKYVELKVGGQSFRCERGLLAAESIYFDTLFEAYSTRQTFEVNEIDKTAFQEINNSMHHRCLIRVVHCTVLPLLRASDFLQLRRNHIEDECFRYLETQSGVINNACEILLYCHAKNKQRFSDLLMAHIRKHVTHFDSDDSILEIPFDIFRKLLPKCHKFFDCDYDQRPCYARGNAVLKMILTWINHSRPERGQYRKELMSYVSSADVSMDYALSLMMRCESVLDGAASDPGGNVALQAGMNQLVYHRYSDIKFATGTTLTLKLWPFSRMKTASLKRTYSCEVHGVTWTVEVEYGKNLVSFQFYANREYAKDLYFMACVNIVSKKEGVEDSKNFIRGGYVNSKCQSLVSFSKFCFDYDYISGEDNGYIENDTIHVQVRVSL